MPFAPSLWLKRCAWTVVTCTLLIGAMPHASHADDVPLAGRLLAEPYTSTGVQVTVDALSNMYGLATDGTTAYAIDSDGTVVTTPLASIASQPGGSAVEVSGTRHTVAWGVDGAPAWPDASDLSLAFSHGCLFITNNNNNLGEIHLYCIDVSDYTVTDLSIPVDKPLLPGNYFVKSSLIDFPDGRIGKVSAETYSMDDSQYESTLRTYTLTGTGKSVSLTWSHDFVMGDPDYFATDEHGIATDGTYLYRIQWRSHNPNTKVWTLSNTATSTVIYSGMYTMPFGNMHFLAHNHIDSYYLVGHYSSNHFFITREADPGPGPGHGLVPAYANVTSTIGGYAVQVTNYDPSFTWSATSTAGVASIDGSGVLTVTGLAEGASATTTVTATHVGFPDGSSAVVGTALDVTPPVISALSSTSTEATTTIQWSTNELASTQITFGPTATYSSTTALADLAPRVLSHVWTLNPLPSCTTYHFAVISSDASGNTSTSTDNVFTTLGCTASSTPLGTNATTTSVETGGSVSATTTSATFTVTTPAAVTATSTSLVIQIQQIAKSDVTSAIGVPADHPNEVGSTVFDVKAIINDTTVLDSFDYPVTISYHYSSGEVAGLLESSLRLYHYHDGAWQALNSCSVNSAAQLVTCTTPNFSIFALFGQLLPPPVAHGGGAVLIDVQPTAVSQSGSGTVSTPLAFTINDGSGTTNNSLVTLHFNADPRTVKGYAVSLDPSFRATGINPLTASTTQATFQLPQVPGDDTLYLKYYSITGNPSAVLAQTITLVLRSTERASTVTVAPSQTQSTICKYTTTLRLGSRGREVKDLQLFLKSRGTSIYPEGVVNSLFDKATKRAVIRFQELYAQDVLQPWGILKGTGYVYRTTKAKMCALSK